MNDTTRNAVVDVLGFPRNFRDSAYVAKDRDTLRDIVVRLMQNYCAIHKTDMRELHRFLREDEEEPSMPKMAWLSFFKENYALALRQVEGRSSGPTSSSSHDISKMMQRLLESKISTSGKHQFLQTYAYPYQSVVNKFWRYPFRALRIEELPIPNGETWPRNRPTRRTKAGANITARTNVLERPVNFVEDPANEQLNEIFSRLNRASARVFARRIFNAICNAPLNGSQSQMLWRNVGEALHKRGFIILNWPYGTRRFVSDDKDKLNQRSVSELRVIIQALLHPNPSSRLQIVSRHHFAGKKSESPGYITYVTAFKPVPSSRVITEEDHFVQPLDAGRSDKVPPAPPVINNARGHLKCPCNLSQCTPLDLGPEIRKIVKGLALEGASPDAGTFDFLSPSDLPRIPRRPWPRITGRMTRYTPIDEHLSYYVAQPPEHFLEDPVNGQLDLSKLSRSASTAAFSKIMIMVIGDPLGQQCLPWKTKLQTMLHDAGLVIINWPYGTRRFNDAERDRPICRTLKERTLILTAAMHPNPASRLMVVSRHHFPSGSEPAYINYRTSYSETATDRTVSDEDFFVVPSSRPIIKRYKDGECPCALSTCSPPDLVTCQQILNGQYVGGVGGPTIGDAREPSPCHDSDATSSDLESADESQPENAASSHRSQPAAAKKRRAPGTDSEAKRPRTRRRIEFAQDAQNVAEATRSGEDAPSSGEDDEVVEVAAASAGAKVDISTATKYANEARRLAKKSGASLKAVKQLVDEIYAKHIPKHPPFPPDGPKDWADVYISAKSAGVDSVWLSERMLGWISKILARDTVPLSVIVRVSRALKNLALALGDDTHLEYLEKVNQASRKWWLGSITLSSSASQFANAMTVLLEANARGEINFQEQQEIEDHWKKSWRTGLRKFGSKSKA
ncbi:hypothetical protein SISSUDRAFT_1038134 [Sistotremastrum suecicum HHB10207 ss-3]|uniref:Uncharacterized protein n=1 Tax=Sistotremastrum suecicum HHB10207 ss-3 TaxID=1314776 RepID=A0A165X6A4_9AGAM|nr:hypothetical protein SISSUDRAFT_1038134 [Sistotremastrum suecicum HHB10207 ss-3]